MSVREWEEVQEVLREVEEGKEKPKDESGKSKAGKGSGSFWRTESTEELAAEQGVKPVTDIDSLKGDFWPEDESIDEFLDWVYNVHRRGGLDALPREPINREDMADTLFTTDWEAELATYRRPGGAIIVGDALTTLARVPDGVFRCCITSPPYWGLRDYGIPYQIGAEVTVEDYVFNLRRVFAEVRRTLAEDGTLWLNLGDCYTSGGRAWRAPDRKNPARAMDYRPETPAGLKPKDLLGLPWRVAFALQEDGWYLRSDIIWYKPNCQPESVKDRPTRAHEYIFLFSKSERYYYDHEAVRESCNGNGRTRNRRSVWAINTEPNSEAHFATFPPALVEPCVSAGTEQGDLVLDPFFGSGTVGEVCRRRGRRFVGIELKDEYAQIAQRRLGWEG